MPVAPLFFETLWMADSWETLKLLADSTRIRILSLLTREELSVAELQEVLDMGQSRISSHLGLLRQGELVHDRREGKKTFLHLILFRCFPLVHALSTQAYPILSVLIS